VYAANEVPEDISGWSKVSRDIEVTQDARVTVDTLDRTYRYYLLWITDLGDNERAEIQELTLQR